MQEHLLPLQHYIIEQAKLSGCCRLDGDTMDSDSLHSDTQSEHSFSGHEPDNEDSDHSDGHGDYLTHHYGAMYDYNALRIVGNSSGVGNAVNAVGVCGDGGAIGASYYNLNLGFDNNDKEDM